MENENFEKTASEIEESFDELIEEELKPEKGKKKAALAIAKNAFDGAKAFTKNKVVPATKKAVENTKQFTKDKVVPTAKKAVEKTKEGVDKVANKVKTSITEEQMQDVLNKLYIQSVNGIPKVSLPIEDLVKDYLSKNKDVDKAAKSLINNSIVKCGTSGFLTGLGGFLSMIATLPANITSVMYVQLRMCCAIAKMGGYDIHSDQVQTMIYACLTGSAMSDILKQAGIKFGNKFGVAMVKKIPGAVINKINQKVGFRFITKFGETGIVNLAKVVPVLGGVIGGGVDVASTRIIGNNAYSLFINGEVPDKKSAEEILGELPIDAEATLVEDIDTEMLEQATQDGEVQSISE